MKKILLFIGLVVGLCSTSFAQMYEHTEQEVEEKYEQCVLLSNQVSAANATYVMDESAFFNLWSRAYNEKDDLAESTLGQNHLNLAALVDAMLVYSGGGSAIAEAGNWKTTKETRFNSAVANDIEAGLAKNNHNWDVAYSKYSAANSDYNAVLVCIDASNAIFTEMNPKYEAFLNELEGVAYGVYSSANCSYDESEQTKYEVTSLKDNCHQWFQLTSEKMHRYRLAFDEDYLYMNTLIPLADDASNHQTNGNNKYTDAEIFDAEGMIFIGSADVNLGLNRLAASLDDSWEAGSRFNMKKIRLLQAKTHYEDSDGIYSYLHSILDAALP